MKSFLPMQFDKHWCGNHQIPASLLFDISGNFDSAKKLAHFRFLLFIFLILELTGFFFITLGLSNTHSIFFFIIGIVLKIVGALSGAFFQNRSGAYLSLELQKYLKLATNHSLEIKTLLAENGCTEAEIQALPNLPADVYQSELSAYQRTRIINIGAPLFCGLALLLTGDFITSSIVIILGVLSFPLGEYFFKESTFRKESELRLGLAAQLQEYVAKIYNEHVWLTTKVNFVSQIPLLLFSIRLLWNSSGQLLSSFFALTQGLIGLTGTLGFQKARASAVRTTETTRHLIKSLTSPYLIVTPKRWKEHCEKILLSEHKVNFSDGLVFKNFAPLLPFEQQMATSTSFTICYGSACIVKGSSGKGKTTFINALTHLIEHTGEMFFSENKVVTNIHDLSREEFEKKIFYFREDSIDKSGRIIDIFKSVTSLILKPFLEAQIQHFGALLVNLAWHAPDNLIEKEIQRLERREPSTFPSKMLDFLKLIRSQQIAEISNFLKNAQGNLNTKRVYPERIFHTLSSGEKRRLATLLAFETCRIKGEVILAILDEPLSHLDEENVTYQIEMIKLIQRLRSPPALLLTSHLFVDRIKKLLDDVSEIELSY